ncbi:MAG: competence/damage-inducible protein A [Candidatus Theseobacter exili]|nr:competence/damage-inducible protein A [Candidatus Theseobacter exili]
MLRVNILTVGDELLCGDVRDSNFQYLASILSDNGIEVCRHMTLMDKTEDVKKAIILSLNESDWVIVTGGLGPTTDDITKEAAAQALGVKLFKSQEKMDELKRRFLSFKKSMPSCNEVQAFLPEGSVALYNSIGTAPGIFAANASGKKLVLLPGPPREMVPMFEEQVLHKLLKESEDRIKKEYIVLRTTGLGESVIQQKVTESKLEKWGVKSAFYASVGDVKIKLSAVGSDIEETVKRLKSAERCLKRRLYPYIYGKGEDEILEKIVGRMLRRQGLTLSIAESCTGGLLAGRLTEVPGSSAFFHLGIVSYSNESKIKQLGVNRKTIEKYGAVSEYVAREMAMGVMWKSKADIGVGITGIAGPAGGTMDKPVGSVYIGLADKRGQIVKYFQFPGDRISVRSRTVQTSLDLLRRRILRIV